MLASTLLLLCFGGGAVLSQQTTKAKPQFRDEQYKNISFMDWLLYGEIRRCGREGCPYTPKHYEYEGYDGFYNNFGRPDLGSVDTPLLRRTPAAYKDGVYEPSGYNRPSPLILSQSLLEGPVGSRSKTGRNAFIVFFGQQVVEEILDAQRAACPPEYFNLKIPKEGHHYSKIHSELPVLRTRFDARTGYTPNNPRQQLNEITPYIDGGLVYGTTKAWSDVLRTYANGSIDENGLLATSYDGLFPELNTMRLPMANPPPPANHTQYINRHYIGRVERFFKLGNPRGNENAYLLTFGVLWFRWHNHVARNLRRNHPDWSGEKVYNEARRWVIGTQQHIIVNEWLPAWLGEELPEYEGYDPSVDPQIDQFFQAAAFRFGHTLVPPAVKTRSRITEGCKSGTIVRTCNSFWRPQEIFREIGGGDDSTMGIGMEKLILGMTTQLCEKEDHKIVEDLRGMVFGPLEFSRRDLMAINIQRARDHGLPDYNTVREYFGLRRVDNLSHFKNADANVQKNFSELYGYNKFDDIDLWVGGIMETDTGPGELFKTIIIDQFKRIRNGDRFWYNNTQNGLFTVDEIDRIKQTTFRDILLSVTNITTSDIPMNPFGVPIENVDRELISNTNCGFRRIECLLLRPRRRNDAMCFHTSATEDEIKDIPCVPLGTYDYFSTSEAPYILTFSALGAIIIGLVILLRIMLLFRHKKCAQNSEKSTSKLRASIKMSGMEKKMITADEWIGHTKPERPVVVEFKTAKKQIRVKDTSGHMIRVLDLNHNPLTKIFLTTDHHYVLIRVEHNYDLVLKFPSDYMRQSFITNLEDFAEHINMRKEYTKNIPKAAMLKQVKTKKQRQMNLEKFFRVVFAGGFKKNDSKFRFRGSPTDSKVDNDVARMELTIIEFAEVFSMSPDSEFIKKMFDLVDKDKNGFISFREFMDMSVIFFKGTPDEKIELMFNMYDIRGEGKLSRRDFGDMLRLVSHYHNTAERDRLNLLPKIQFLRNNSQTVVPTAKIDIIKLVADKIIYKIVPQVIFVGYITSEIAPFNERTTCFRSFFGWLYLRSYASHEDRLRNKFVENFVGYNFDNNYFGRRENRSRVIQQKLLRLSLMATVNEDLEPDKLDEVIDTMMEAAGMPADQDSIDLDGFRHLLRDYKHNLSLDFDGLPGTPNRAQRVVESMYGDIRELHSRIEGDSTKPLIELPVDINSDAGLIKEKAKETYWSPVTKYIADKQLEIFWIFIYTSVLFAIFAERAYYYQVEREHSGLRQIAGPGVTITRGAASAMMFTYSTLLLTMCQNTITTLRDTFLHVYIPFDSSLEMHKYAAFWALIFTVLHVMGHAVNFYHIATQTSDDLTCLFPNFFHSTHEIPKFGYWCWQTITGVTGIALTTQAAIMFTFALPVIRRRLYNWFWFTHSTYPIFFILFILHGLGRLVQAPFAYLFLSGPVVLFVLDKIVAASRKSAEIQITKAACLPSGVTYLSFKKPQNFQHKSGQWVRISCNEFNRNEYHPFTISSAPHETDLTVHIRAVGPWTQEIRNTVQERSLRTLRVDGPYGEGAQDWYKYDVGIMIGGGIGVTPFASILKDIVYKSNLNQNLGCKKVYFLWVTRTQRQFEWMVDILRELEAADVNNVVSSHIFITQFYHKYDLRTVLLYVCERYFQRVSNKSLFTGLKAITHFGRPDFLKFFRSIRQLNNSTNKVGVFTCGPRIMINTVDRACHTLNREMVDTSTLFKHHYKNF